LWAFAYPEYLRVFIASIASIEQKSLEKFLKADNL
jgi:hypothetical protein